MLEDMKVPMHGGRVCRVAIIARGLSEHDSEILMKAVDSPNWPINTLSNELSKRGIAVSPPTLKRHRLRVCVCSNA
jgi:hypothetical protein